MIAPSNKNTIAAYNHSLESEDQKICEFLAGYMNKHLTNSTSKIWHGAPVWFLNDNPTVGYSKLKSGIKLMFWSGADFDEKELIPGSGKFKDASITYNSFSEINQDDLRRWLEKSTKIQWDYKNIVKRKGVLVKI